MTSSEMKAYVFNGGGGPEVIELIEREIPTAGPGEVLVKVEAFGLNRADVQQRRGHYPPPPGASDIPGLEAAGVIAALGEGVAGWAVGDRVAALLAAGGYAQYVNVPAGQLIAIPDNMEAAEAAGLPEVASTVVSNIFLEGQLAAGQILLVHGGAGGIGSMAIQLAKAAGARVIVTAGNQEKIAYCLQLGAEAGINYRDEDVLARISELTEGHGADVILDVIGAKYLELNVKALAEDGRLVIIGLQGGAKAELDLGLLLAKRGRVIATTLRRRPVAQKAHIIDEVKARVLPLIERGELQLNVNKVFAFSEAAAAHEYFDSGRHTGKIVVTA